MKRTKPVSQLKEKAQKKSDEQADLKNYQSRFQIGEQCHVEFSTKSPENVYFIRAITFSNAKVRYAVFSDKYKTTLHNIDSVFVMKVKSPKFVDFGADNYS